MELFNRGVTRKAKLLVTGGASVVLATTLLTFGLTAGPAVGSDGNGGASRTWISGVGDDVNPCSRTAPCKTWAGAISKTVQPGGEIDALDPGGFGAVTITGGITLNGGPGVAGLLAGAGGNTINVQAANTDTVILRNLDLNGLAPGPGPALNGINFISGRTLYIENSTIENFTGDAVHVAPTAGGGVTLINDVLRNNGGNGVLAQPGTSSVAMLVKGCTIQQNGAAGISARGNGPQTSTIYIHNNDITGNGSGLATTPGGSTVSYGGNVVDANGTNGSPTVTRAPV